MQVHLLVESFLHHAVIAVTKQKLLFRSGRGPFPLHSFTHSH